MILFLSILKAVLFLIVINVIGDCDKDNAIMVSEKEAVLMAFLITLAESALFKIHGVGLDCFYHGMVIYYLLVAAYIDHKTGNVYRIGSLFFILSNILVCVFLYRMNAYERLESAVYVGMFSIIVILLGVFKMMGWGDVFTYIGLFVWFGTWRASWMLLEIILVYILLANLVFLVLNAGNIDIRKGKIKGRGAYLPAMAVGSILLELLVYGFS